MTNEQKSEVGEAMQRLKCLFGFHKERWLGFSKPFYQQVLMKCDCCGKYNVWHRGINVDYWTKDLDKIPKEIREFIIENNL